MPEDDSVSAWIEQLKESADEDAAQKLYDRYIDRLAAKAKTRLSPGRRREADEQDLALQAMNSLFRGMRDARFPQLSNRNDLWAILLTLVDRRASDLHRRNSAQKRGGGETLGESALIRLDSDGSQQGGIGEVPGRDPAPDVLAQMNEELTLRLKELKDLQLQRIAVMSMQGFTNEDIAQQLGCVVRTVERRLADIRGIWSGK